MKPRWRFSVARAFFFCVWGVLSSAHLFLLVGQVHKPTNTQLNTPPNTNQGRSVTGRDRKYAGGLLLVGEGGGGRRSAMRRRWSTVLDFCTPFSPGGVGSEPCSSSCSKESGRLGGAFAAKPNHPKLVDTCPMMMARPTVERTRRVLVGSRERETRSARRGEREGGWLEWNAAAVPLRLAPNLPRTGAYKISQVFAS